MERLVKLPPNFDMRASNAASKQEVSSDKIKLALLRNMLGTDSARVLLTLPLSEDKINNYDSVMAAIEQYVSPRVNEVFERYKFNERKQKRGESFDNFFTECKQLLLNCSYRNVKNESIEDQLLRDKIVQGICDKGLQENLRNLTLEKASNFCRTSEQSKLQVKEMNPTVEVDYSKTKSPKKDGVFRCKRYQTTHGSRQCPAFGKKCKKCGIKNHFALSYKVNNKVRQVVKCIDK